MAGRAADYTQVVAALGSGKALARLLLAQCLRNGGGDLFREMARAFRRVVDVRGQLGFRFGERVGAQIVGGHASGGHDLRGGGIVFFFIAFDTAVAAGGDVGGVAPDEFRAGGLQRFHQRGEVLFVIGERDLEMSALGLGIGTLRGIVADVFEVVEAPIEVNDVPFAVAEPFGEIGEAVGGGAAVGGDAVDVRFAFELLPHVERVTDGDAIADEQHAREACDILDGREGRIRGAFLRRFRRLSSERGKRGEKEGEQGDAFHARLKTRPVRLHFIQLAA